MFSDVASALRGSFDSAYIMTGGFGFGAAPASTGAVAGLERGEQLDRLCYRYFSYAA